MTSCISSLTQKLQTKPSDAFSYKLRVLRLIEGTHREPLYTRQGICDVIGIRRRRGAGRRHAHRPAANGGRQQATQSPRSSKKHMAGHVMTPWNRRTTYYCYRTGWNQPENRRNFANAERQCPSNSSILSGPSVLKNVGAALKQHQDWAERTLLAGALISAI